MSPRPSLPLAAAAAVLFVAGLALSRLVEPGVRVDSVTLARETPALRFMPPAPGPHPIALLAHGVSASKETLFRLGEALARAGFEGYAIDLPGHGDSRQRFPEDNVRTIDEISRALGHVEVFAGHSMGAYAGAASVRHGALAPRVFIAMGAFAQLGDASTPLLLLSGRFDEAIPARRLQARTDARLVLSPWSDHALEPYDPTLVDAAVTAATAAVGTAPPPAGQRWRWRLAGMVLGVLGALVLGDQLPRLVPRLARARGFLLAIVLILGTALVTGTWLGAMPVLRRVPIQLVTILLSGLAVLIAAKLRAPRWTFVAIAAALGLALFAIGASFFALLAALLTLVLAVGVVLARIAERGGTARDGDIAFAIFVGYAIGQWVPRVF